MSLFVGKITRIAIGIVLLSTQSLFSQDQSEPPETVNDARPKLETETRSIPSSFVTVLGKQAKPLSSPDLTLEKTADPELTTSLLDYRVPFSILFKYNTSPSNPDHHCYEIRKPLTRNYTFLFNFLSTQQYNLSASLK